MANCDEGCNCLIRAGEGLSVTGAGTRNSPYVVSLLGTGENFIVNDTQTVNLTLIGGGTPEDPFQLSATATVKLTQLADVNDPQGGPNAGDVPVWVTSGTPHWEFQPPPVAPAGAVNVSTGIIGDGSVGSPIRVRLIGTNAGGTTSGLEVYADSAGNLRAVSPGGLSVSWADITGKPSFFPTNDSNFSGVLSVAKGGTGQNDLANVTVGNSTRIENRRIFTQSGTPSSPSTNDLWFW